MSRGADSWPYYLQEITKCTLTNLALGLSGNKYIHNSTITELSLRKYDMVLIMWATVGRIDMQVEDITQFADSKSTSVYQSAQNDWPTKVIHPINDQDYVQKNWIFSHNRDFSKEDSVSTLLRPLHTHTKQAQYMYIESDLIKMISLQSVLKSLNTPYLFMFWSDFHEFDRFTHLYNMIDWTNVYTDHTLESIGKKNNWYQKDKIHFNEQANEAYAKLIATRIT